MQLSTRNKKCRDQFGVNYILTFFLQLLVRVPPAVALGVLALVYTLLQVEPVFQASTAGHKAQASREQMLRLEAVRGQLIKMIVIDRFDVGQTKIDLSLNRK